MVIMRASRTVRICLLCLLGTLLAACQPVSQPAPPIPQPAPPPVIPDRSDEDLAAAYREELRQQLEIADLLYQGLRALAADRLMTPAEGSALSLFNRVLTLQPGNEVALQGMKDISSRYLQLAEASARQGQFENARLYMQRAEIVFPGNEAYEGTARLVELERSRTHSVHTLSARELIARSDTVVRQLRDIALQAREMDVFLMITAPNDTHGRWIYGQMQEAAGEYRLRGDIEIGEQPSVRLVLAPARS